MKEELIIPNDLPNRHWNELNREEAEKRWKYRIVLVVGIVALFVFGMFYGLIFGNNNKIPVQTAINYYTATGQAPSKMWIEWYENTHNGIMRPTLSVDQIRESLLPLGGN